MTWTAPDVVILPASNEDVALATALAQRSGLTLCSAVSQNSVSHKAENTTRSQVDSSWLLKVQNQQLSLIRPDGLSVAIDFVGGKAFKRTREANFKSQPLARALGLQKLKSLYLPSNSYPKVIDATAGLGIDGWMMAHLDCSVRLIEASTILSLMLEQAVIAQSSFPPASKRLQVINANAIDYLNNADSARADIIYLDPMYPQSRNKSLVKKGMQLLHELIGPDNDDPALLHAALNKSDYRVVVKRPKGAPQLAGSEQWTGQITQVNSPNTRYDVYHIQTS